MKATHRPGDVGTLLSELDQRLRRLEQASSTTHGPWRVTVNPAGALVAVHVPSGVTRTLAAPEA